MNLENLESSLDCALRPIFKSPVGIELENQDLLAGENQILRKSSQSENNPTQEFFVKYGNKSFWQTYSLILIDGLKVAICYADYYIFMIFVRIFLTKINNLSLMASLSYATIFFSATIIMINAGVHDTLTAYMSEFMGKQDFMMVRKTVQTSTKMQVVLFSIFTALPGIFMNRVFPLINVPFENQEESHLLILVLLPAMLIRSLNENFKAFFINLGEISMTGLITLASLAPGVLLAYFLLVTYRLGFAGIVITITAYSSVSLGLMIWKLQTRIIPELKRQQEILVGQASLEDSIGSKGVNFFKFGCQSLKFTSTILATCILWNVLGVIAGMLGVASEFATFGLIMDVTDFFYSFFFAICYLLKMILAHIIVRRDAAKVKEQIRSQMSISVINSVLSGLVMASILQIAIWIAQDDQYKADLRSSQVIASIMVTSMGLRVSIASIMKNFNYLGFLTTMSTITSFGVASVAYYLAITRKKGLSGLMHAVLVYPICLVLDLSWLYCWLSVDKEINLVNFTSGVTLE